MQISYFSIKQLLLYTHWKDEKLPVSSKNKCLFEEIRIISLISLKKLCLQKVHVIGR